MRQTIERERRRIGVTAGHCSLCGHDGLELIESRRVAHGLALRQRLHGAHLRRYELCPSCGAHTDPDGDGEGLSGG